MFRHYCRCTEGTERGGKQEEVQRSVCHELFLGVFHLHSNSSHALQNSNLFIVHISATLPNMKLINILDVEPFWTTS